MDPDAFKLEFIESLCDPTVADKLKAIFISANEGLREEIKATREAVQSLKQQLTAKDEIIKKLQSWQFICDFINGHIDDFLLCFATANLPYCFVLVREVRFPGYIARAPMIQVFVRSLLGGALLL